MSKLVDIVLVGRTNVGKSTLFNRITHSKRSIVLDQEGVTRDCISEVATWNGITFNLVDTGGISLVKKQDYIATQIFNKVEKVVKNAAAVLFVCDVQSGITAEDQRIARRLHKLGCPVFVVVNKVENAETQMKVYEFERFGFKDIFPVSAQHAQGVGDLLDELVTIIRETKPEEDDKEITPRITLVGKPNVGKSSLINRLLDDDFAIVSSQEGTTREALHKKIQFNKSSFELVDTAGIRRKKSVDEGLETMMVQNSLQAVRKAHLVLLMMDAEDSQLSSQVLKLSQYAYENGSALILLINKSDLFNDTIIEKLDLSMLEYDFIMKKIEVLKISCLDGKNVGKVLPLVEKVWDRYTQRFSESFLSDIFIQQLFKTPLYKNGKLLSFYRAKQIGTAPIRIELIVAHPQFFSAMQYAFFENVLRKKVDLKGVPIMFYAHRRK